MEQDRYAKYCNTDEGVRMVIAHGAMDPDTVRGVGALRLMWR
jgi:hypothetical protein